MKKYTFSVPKNNIDHVNNFLYEFKVADVCVPPIQNEKQFPRTQKKNRHCIFCNKSYGETNFNSNPHIISKLLSLNHGYSNLECDDCNSYFGNLENDLTDFLGLERTLFMLGERKVKTFQTSQDAIIAKSIDRNNQSGIEITSNTKLEVIASEDKNDFILTYDTRPYIPVNVYRILLKIALSRMPSDYIKHNRPLLEFVRYNKHNDYYKQFAKYVFKCSLPVELRRPYLMIFSNQGKDDTLPEFIFSLYFKKTCLQVIMPYVLEKGLKVNIPLCPPMIIGVHEIEANVVLENINLSSSEKTVEKKKVRFQFNNKNTDSKKEDTKFYKSVDIGSLFINRV